MPRRPRELNELGVYHAFGRVLRPGARPFADPALAEVFVAALKEAKRRFDFLVFGWVLLPSSFHLVVRGEGGLLGKLMASLRGQVARWRNKRKGSRGSFWGDRYAVARLHRREDVCSAIAYVHSRPQAEGLADCYAYRWSGQREFARGEAMVLDVDRSLALFGRARAQAVAAYRAAVENTGIMWPRVPVWRLPWWRAKRRSVGQETAVGSVLLASEGTRVAALVRLACAVLGVPFFRLASRRRGKDVTTAREIILLMGVGVLRMPVGALATTLGLSPSAASRAFSRAERRVVSDSIFAARVERLRHLLKNDAGARAAVIGCSCDEGLSRSIAAWLNKRNEARVSRAITGGSGEVEAEVVSGGAGFWRNDIFIDPKPLTTGSIKIPGVGLEFLVKQATDGGV